MTAVLIIIVICLFFWVLKIRNVLYRANKIQNLLKTRIEHLEENISKLAAKEDKDVEASEEAIASEAKGISEVDALQRIEEDAIIPRVRTEPLIQPAATTANVTLTTPRIYKKLNNQIKGKEYELHKEHEVHKEHKEQVQSKTIDWGKLFTIESIISKLGILLLLIGVGFIYKLAYDNGYVTPSLAVIFGYLIGFAVIGLGVQVLKKKRVALSQVLFGGGIGILYIATFAAYLGYELIGSFLAFVILFTITFSCFFIALSIDSVVMSIVALLGGLLTPFIIGIDYLGLYGMGVYLFVLSVGSIIIYYFKRWRSLQLSTIITVNLITLMIAIDGGLTLSESFDFTLLIVLLFILFAGLEYVLFYLRKDNQSQIVLTALIISILPLVTLVQALTVLDLQQATWAIVFMIIAFIFFLLNFIIYKKRGQSIVSDITLCYIGFFLLVAIILYFGGEVRYIAILIQSLIFIFISKRMNNITTKIIGWIVFTIGYSWSLFALIESVDNGDVSLLTMTIRLLVVLLLTIAALFHDKWQRKIIGALAYQVYFILGFLSLVYELVDFENTMIVFIIAYGLVIWIFLLLNKYLKLLSLRSILVYSIFPFLGQMVYSGFIIYDDSIIWLNTLGFILYGVNLYVISITILKDKALYTMVILKVVAYLSFSSVMLVEISQWSGHMGYGLALFACLAIGINYIENEEIIGMKILMHSLKILFVVLFVLYSFAGVDIGSFNIVHFILDLALLIAVYYIFTLYIRDSRMVLISHIAVYMLVVYQHLSLEENGIVTMFWAAYGIVGMAYFITKGKRHLSYICLGLIIFVATKFVLIDLSTIAIFWKIITSMAFGIALLILSYIIQPLIKRFEEADK